MFLFLWDGGAAARKSRPEDMSSEELLFIFTMSRKCLSRPQSVEKKDNSI
jgi:hypothetical protein